MAAALALISSLLWGTADFLGGTASRRRPALAVFAGSQIPGFIVLATVAMVTGSWSADPGFWPWAVASGLLGMAGLTAFYSALAMGTMGIVAPAAALGVLVPLAVGLARGESPEPAQVLGIVFAIGGILLASGPELSDAGGTRPVLLALLAALLFGAMYIAMAGGAQVDAVMTVAGMRVTTLTVIVGLVLVTRSVGGLGRADVPVITAIGISDGVANLTWVVASTLGLLSITSVLGSLYPVVTAVLAAVLHHERLRPVQYVGVVGAIAGVILISAGG